MIVVNNINGTYEAREAPMKRYLEQERLMMMTFKSFTIAQVPKLRNKQVDASIKNGFDKF